MNGSKSAVMYLTGSMQFIQILHLFAPSPPPAHIVCSYIFRLAWWSHGCPELARHIPCTEAVLEHSCMFWESPGVSVSCVSSFTSCLDVGESMLVLWTACVSYAVERFDQTKLNLLFIFCTKSYDPRSPTLDGLKFAWQLGDYEVFDVSSIRKCFFYLKFVLHKCFLLCYPLIFLHLFVIGPFMKISPHFVHYWNALQSCIPPYIPTSFGRDLLVAHMSAHYRLLCVSENARSPQEHGRPDLSPTGYIFCC